MDETAAWAILRKLQTTGVTSKMEVKFTRNISTDDPQLTIRARIMERKRNAVFVETEIYNGNGEVCTRATIIYFVVSPEEAQARFRFTGCRVEGE
jgi:acyl-coenzyme A thioesterase PaaI-like protein